VTAAIPDPDAFAALLCDWSMAVTPGDRVGILSTTLAEVLAAALHRAVLERDAWPYVALEPPGLAADLYRHAQARHRTEAPPTHMAVTGALDAFVRIEAPANTTELAGVDPAVVAEVATARRPFQEASLKLRWTGTILPTPALAQQAQMSTDEYAGFVTGALFLDRPDPVAAWRDLSAGQEAMVARLSAASEVRIEAEGTDIRLDVTGRTWINSDGRRNMPSGEVFTGPHERSANGTVRFTVPTGPRRGVTVTGVELRFKDGEVVSAKAERGDDYLQAALATDAGARYLGELGIGTNTGIDRATGHVLLDEKIAGTVHLALGRSYPETGGTNESALHWDLICDLRDGGRLSADGEPIVENGALIVV
jgi:aminopeptidase